MNQVLLIAGVITAAGLLLFWGIYAVVGALSERQNLRARLSPSHAVAAAGPSDILRQQTFSDIPRINTLLKQLSVSAYLGKLLAQAGFQFSVATLIYIHLGIAGMSTAIYMAFLAYPLASALPLGLAKGVVLPLLFLRRARKKRLRAFGDQFTGTLELIKSSLHAGHSLNYSLEVATEELPEPMASELRTVLEEMRLGLSAKDALDNFSKRVPLNELRFFMLAVTLTREVGGNLSEVLGTLAHALRERRKLRQKVQALTAQGRASVILLFLIPFVVGGLAHLLVPGFLDPLFVTTPGRIALGAAFSFQLVGFLLVRAVINPRELALG